MKNIFNLLILVIMLSFIGCQPKPSDLKKLLDGWEYITTFKTYPLRSIAIVEKRAKIISGDKNVLVVELERKPILKPNVPQMADLHSYRFLFVELSLSDTLVSPANLGSSKIIREIIAMSPRYGISVLDPSEKIEVRKLTSNRWRVLSDLEDFQFEGEFTFADSSMVTSKHKQMLNN